MIRSGLQMQAMPKARTVNFRAPTAVGCDMSRQGSTRSAAARNQDNALELFLDPLGAVSNRNLHVVRMRELNVEEGS